MRSSGRTRTSRSSQSLGDVDDFGQMLVRALLYRLVAAVEGGFEKDTDAIDRRYRSTVDLAIELAARR